LTVGIAGGAIVQTRVFGGTLGLAITSTILNNYLTSHLINFDTTFIGRLRTNPPRGLPSVSKESQKQVLERFGESCRLNFCILAGLTVAHALAILLLWRSLQIALTVNSTSDTDGQKSVYWGNPLD
jgi:hypothetical protein